MPSLIISLASTAVVALLALPANSLPTRDVAARRVCRSASTSSRSGSPAFTLAITVSSTTVLSKGCRPRICLLYTSSASVMGTVRPFIRESRKQADNLRCALRRFLIEGSSLISRVCRIALLKCTSGACTCFRFAIKEPVFRTTLGGPAYIPLGIAFFNGFNGFGDEAFAIALLALALTRMLGLVFAAVNWPVYLGFRGALGVSFVGREDAMLLDPLLPIPAILPTPILMCARYSGALFVLILILVPIATGIGIVVNAAPLRTRPATTRQRCMVEVEANCVCSVATWPNRSRSRMVISGLMRLWREEEKESGGAAMPKPRSHRSSTRQSHRWRGCASVEEESSKGGRAAERRTAGRRRENG
mmetsp:Transcript_3105/g.7002  ORF Transcript_3105/g.7002 Transcript_3105/m.7002 type:complete len:361 (-) Transcript_3105:5-1087(-)